MLYVEDDIRMLASERKGKKGKEKEKIRKVRINVRKNIGFHTLVLGGTRCARRGAFFRLRLASLIASCLREGFPPFMCSLRAKHAALAIQLDGPLPTPKFARTETPGHPWRWLGPDGERSRRAAGRPSAAAN